ncbi:hypothetical protein [Komagataeibacter saccharivorans]|uniref:hypothetical protein n=1 Tax=Komagataeibacter saccharivorans TaxID=265959 RepID=UPI0024A806CA|nr:hypothetical protein [Komagataeibacter saccharivorans]
MAHTLGMLFQTCALTWYVRYCNMACMNVHEIIRRAGGPLKVGKAINRHHATIIGWKRVPAEHARTVARMADLTPHDLRPDVFGPETTHERGAA